MVVLLLIMMLRKLILSTLSLFFTLNEKDAWYHGVAPESATKLDIFDISPNQVFKNWTKLFRNISGPSGMLVSMEERSSRRDVS